MKVNLDWKDAKKMLLDEIQKKNPGVTDINIEGLITIEAANELINKSTDGMTSISHASGMPTEQPMFAGPNSPDMVALVRSLQVVVDDGRNLTIKFLKGKNKGMTFELTKGLETRCDYCGYIAMSDTDVREHEKTYHKDILEALRKKEKNQLAKAAKTQKEKVQKHDAEVRPTSTWRKPSDKS